MSISCQCKWSGVAVVFWSRSTKLTYIGPS